MGETNYVLHKEERIGSSVTMAKVREFKKYAEEFSLMDLKYTGAFFAWTNKQSGGDRVLSRIDRVNDEWNLKLPASVVHDRNEWLFDHCPAVISWEHGNKGKNKLFKYYNMWSLAADFKEKVKAGWKTERNGTKMYELVGKLHRIKHTLQHLNKDKFSEVEKKADEAIMKLQKFQEDIQNDYCGTELIEEEKKLSQECRSWNKAREQYLRQKSKIQWLTQDDMNTKFFHSMMKERDQVCSHLVRQGPTVSAMHRTKLIEDFTEKEVKEALWAIDGDTAPGLDGFGSQFFKDGWEVVGRDVVDAVMEFFKNGKILKEWNDIVIALIPRSGHASSVGDYRPIACSSRSIVQNILIFQDLVRLYNRKATTKICLIKINLKKAYDAVEWGFVEEMLYAMNFPGKFIKWVMNCISTPQYSITLNGGLYGNIQGKRGLRQGDPISPLLFVICMEYFSRIMGR
ncbi:PREDICTED: uncharacterized protein LOC109244526 [Nicotiana attenuata]|uniref:uncharacterized protein LOC109244526 n=1 Tax=Nicotiana attenuata TaxID=49451 RepID=UPI000905A03B|nr:PREDICTED: uncharacterized protein LOC109244526 [Nicotiana attenuata]